MINVKLTRKKGYGRSVGGSSDGNRYTGGARSTDYATEAGHAKEADHSKNATLAAEATHADSTSNLDPNSSVWTTIQGWIDDLKKNCLNFFLRKDIDDTASGLITFAKGLVSKAKAVFQGDVEVDNSLDVKENLSVGPSGTYGITKDGIATLAGAVAEYLKSSDFSAGKGTGFDGQGYGITKGTDGKYTLEIDNLIARMKMIVAELEVHEMSFIGGTVVMSSCGNRVDRVEALDVGGSRIATADGTKPSLTIPDGKTAERFRCYFLASDGDRQIKNEWTVGQLARAKTNNIASPGDYQNYENRDYWRLVVGVSSAPVSIEGKDYHYIDLSNSTSKEVYLTDTDGTKRLVDLGGFSDTLNSLPFAGDSIIGMGHCWDDTRKNVAILSVLQGGWVIYKGINHYDLPHDNIVGKLAIDEAIITTDHLVLRPYAAPAETQTVAVVRGPYSDSATYGHNDLVTYDGQTWIASGVPIGKTITGEKPSATSPYWSLAAAKGIQGEEGDTGAQGDAYSVVFLLNNVPVDSLNFDDVKASETFVLEADFYNNGDTANVAGASITCYDQDGNVLGSPITSTNTDNIIVDGGNLYLSKDCKYITVVAKDEDGKLLTSKSIGIVRNGTDGTEPISLLLYLTDGAYTWRQGQGKIATIAAAVTKGNYDITDSQDVSQFIWTRESESAQGDKDWNSQHKFGSKTLEVSEGDMCGNITSFVCTLHKSTGEVYTMEKQDFKL